MDTTVAPFPFPEVLHPRPRIAQEVSCEYVRDLTPADLLSIYSAPVLGEAQTLKRITESHHRLARLIAQGFTNVDAARMTGRAVGTVSRLRDDPAFKDLIAHYTDVETELHRDVMAQLDSVNASALSRLEDMLEDPDREFTSEELRKLVETTADRTGFGPTKTIKKQSTGDFIAELVEKVKAEKQGKVIPRMSP